MCLDNVKELKNITLLFNKSKEVYFNIRPAFKIENDIDKDEQENEEVKSSTIPSESSVSLTQENDKLQEIDLKSQSSVSMARNKNDAPESLAGEIDEIKNFERYQAFRYGILKTI